MRQCGIFLADKSGGGQTFFAFLIATLSLLLGEVSLIPKLILAFKISVVATVPFSLYMCVKVSIENCDIISYHKRLRAWLLFLINS